MKNAGGFLIGAGIALIAGYGIWKAIGNRAPKTDDGNGNINPKPPLGNGNDTGGLVGNPTPVKQEFSGKSVRDVLLTTPQSSLKGLKVYSKIDDNNIYTTLNTPYTKAAKGQLLGTFAGATAAKQGGYMVNIKTSDLSNPYVLGYDAFLKF